MPGRIAFGCSTSDAAPELVLVESGLYKSRSPLVLLQANVAVHCSIVWCGVVWCGQMRWRVVRYGVVR